MNNDLQFFTVQVKETLLSIHAQQNLREKALKAVLKYRADIEEYMNRYPEVMISFQPLPFQKIAPEIVKEMLLAARDVSVGPMAAVAGSIAEHVERDLLPFSPEIIVGNGGDIFNSKQEDKEYKNLCCKFSINRENSPADYTGGDTPAKQEKHLN